MRWTRHPDVGKMQGTLIRVREQAPLLVVARVKGAMALIGFVAPA